MRKVKKLGDVYYIQNMFPFPTGRARRSLILSVALVVTMFLSTRLGFSVGVNRKVVGVGVRVKLKGKGQGMCY